MAGFSGNTSTIQQGGSTSATPNTADGTFDPNAVVDTTVGGQSTYDPFGYPTNLGKQEIYVGYLPAVTTGSDRHNTREVGGESLPGVNMGPATSEQKNALATVDDLVKHYHDLATSTNPYTRYVWEQMQEQLQAMDAYGSSTRINFGAWNPNDEKALKFAIMGYLGGQVTGDLPTTMQTFEEYVKQTSQMGAANGLDGNQPGGPGTAGNKPKPILSNPAQINQQTDAMSQNLLGHAADASEQQAIVGQVHNAETTASNEGDMLMRSVTPQSVAREYILNNNLPEYAQHQAESYMNVFANMFLNGANSRANTSLGDAAVPTSGTVTA